MRNAADLSNHTLCLALRWINADVRRDSCPRTQTPGVSPFSCIFNSCYALLVPFDKMPIPPRLYPIPCSLHLTPVTRMRLHISRRISIARTLVSRVP
jgi:hypothetical protein